MKNETKSQSGAYISLLLGTIASSMLGNLLTGKRTVTAGEGTIRAGEGILKKALIPTHPLTNIEIREYYENEPRINGVYSKDNLPKTIKNREHM